MKRLLQIGAALVVLVVLVLLALPFLLDANRYKPLLEQRLGQVLGRTVTIGDLSLSLLSGGVSAADLRISEDPKYGQEAFLSAKALQIGVDMRALIFEKALKVQALTIDQANVALIQDAEGDWNFSSLGAMAPAAAQTPAPATAASPDEPITMEVDRDRLVAAVEFLLDNAVKYTPEGGLITLSWSAGPENASFTVKDNGIGIPAQDLPRIFERFYRVDKARSREMGGTGLGLSIVKHMLQAQGGQIAAKSELGKGTAFTVTLPRP